MINSKDTKFIGLIVLLLIGLFLNFSSYGKTLAPITCHGTMEKVRGVSLYHGIVEFEAEKTKNGYRLRDCNRGIVTLDAGHNTDLAKAIDFTSKGAFFDSDNAKVTNC